MAEVLQTGDVLDGRFRLDAKLGQGAFGAVFRAVDLEQDNLPIAVKVLFDKYHQDRKTRQRFLQEAKLLKDLEHPSIATAYQWRSDETLAYLVMELIDGQSLDQRCSTHSQGARHIPKAGIAWITEQLCAAVDFAHQQGVIHRDLKPRNVMVNNPGARPFVKVLDFGIAKVLVGSEVDPTTVGRVLGSVLYIAPEQILSRPLDHRADIFSLGTILFEMLTLRRAWARTAEDEPHPFHVPVPIGAVNNHVSILRRIAREARPSACAWRPDLPPAVDEVLHRALAVDANQRYSSAAEFARDLRLALDDNLPALDAVPEDVGPPTLDERPPVPPDLLGEVPDVEASAITERPLPKVDLPPALSTEPGDLVEAAPAVRLEATNTMNPDAPEPAAASTEPVAVVKPPTQPSVAPWLALGIVVAVITALLLSFGLQP